jgi:hypothetical protein
MSEYNLENLTVKLFENTVGFAAHSLLKPALQTFLRWIRLGDGYRPAYSYSPHDDQIVGAFCQVSLELLRGVVTTALLAALFLLVALVTVLVAPVCLANPAVKQVVLGAGAAVWDVVYPLVIGFDDDFGAGLQLALAELERTKLMQGESVESLGGGE